MSITLRPYQEKARDAIISDWESRQSVMAVLSTGCGKTELFLGTLAAERESCLAQGKPFRALVLAHVKELVEQPASRVALNWRGKLPPVGIVQGSKNQIDRQMIVATVQTLMPRRISQPMLVYNDDGSIEMTQATTDHEMPLTDVDGARITVTCISEGDEPITPDSFELAYFHGIHVTTDNHESATLANYHPLYEGRPVRIEQIDYGLFGYVYDDTGEDVMVPQTKKSPIQQFSRLRDVLENGGHFSHVVVDECHHAVSPSYRKLLRCIRMLNPDVRILGVTATPIRADKIGMINTFKRCSYKIGLFEAIYILKCLVPFVAKGVALPTADIGALEESSKGNDFTAKELDQLGNVLSEENSLELIIDTWEKEAGDRPTIMYTASVRQAEVLCAAFVAKGHAAEWAHGGTKRDERNRIVADFKSGKLQVLVNCQLFTEGLDVPQISCVGVVRPTKSIGMYMQMAGRGLRLYPNKSECIILDYVPLGSRNLRLADDLLGTMEDRRNAVKGVIDEMNDGEDVDLELISELECLQQLVLTGDIDKAFQFSSEDVVVKVMDFFQTSALEWTVEGDIATATVASNHATAIIMPQQSRIDAAREIIERGDWDEKWNPHLDAIRSYQVVAINGGVNRIGQFGDWETAAKVAGLYADENKDKRLAHSSSDWRERPPSSGQIYKAKQVGIVEPERMTRGALSAALTHKVAVAALLKSGIIKS